MRRLNLTTSLTIAGDATTGSIAYSGFTSPTVTEIGDNPNVSVSSGGVFTLAQNLGSDSETIAVRVEKDGYAIEGPVTVNGNGTGVDYMKLGMNLASVNSYNGAIPFSNLLYNSRVWERVSGSGAWSQSFGTLTAAVSTDVFRILLSTSGTGLPDGTYTIHNPDGLNIALGHGSSQNARYGYSTATSATFTYNPASGDITSNSNGLWLHVKGSVTKALGNLAVILPGQDTEWQAGNPWNSQFLSFMSGINVSPLRFMDWAVASGCYETDWTDRTPSTALNFCNPAGGLQAVIPWELQIDLANRLGVDPWFCVPARATTAYQTSLANLIDSDLDSALTVWLERANEIWNTDDPWADGTGWVNYLNHTRKVATADPATNIFTLAGHGYSTGQKVYCFASADNYASMSNQSTRETQYTLRLAWPNFMEVLSADTFKLHLVSAAGAVQDILPGQLTQIFVVDGEVGKTVGYDTHYAELCLETWDVFDPIIGAGRVEHICGSQAAVVSHSTNRASAFGASESRVDYLAVAPYWAGTMVGAQIATASGSLTPSVWANVSGTIYFALYAAGSTPTNADIKAGTGAIATSGGAYTTAAFWRGGSAGLTAVTGLSDGTDYEAFFLFHETTNDRDWVWSDTITATASVTTLNVFDTYAQQAIRENLEALSSQPNLNHLSGFSRAELIYYEAALGHTDATVSEMDVWRSDYQQSAEGAAQLADGIHIRAALGSRALCYFGDVGMNGNTTKTAPFTMCKTYADTSESRYTEFAALNGRAEIRTMLTVDNITATPITSDPGSFPYTVAALPTGNTYTIIGGNDQGNFDISGTTLRMINDAGIDWTPQRGQTLTILANDGYTADLFTAYILTGAQWYEVGALIDVDYENDRAYVAGVEYASVAAARTAGAIVQSGGIDRIATTGLGSDYVIAGKGITGSTTQSNATSRYLVCVDDGADGVALDELAALAQSRSSVSYLNGSIITGSANQVDSTWESSSGATNSTAVRIAARIKANDSAISFNGGTAIADTSVSIPTVTQMVVGNREDGTRAWTGTIHRVAIVNAAISDAALRDIIA